MATKTISNFHVSISKKQGVVAPAFEGHVEVFYTTDLAGVPRNTEKIAIDISDPLKAELETLCEQAKVVLADGFEVTELPNAIEVLPDVEAV